MTVMTMQVVKTMLHALHVAQGRAPCPLYLEAIVEAEKALMDGDHKYLTIVPDHHDRIVWRNNYYRLPLKVK